jgi:hypothetical protein
VQRSGEVRRIAGVVSYALRPLNTESQMKIKLANPPRIHNGDEEPVMIILTDQDKRNIRNMAPEATKYACYPDCISDDAISEWMKDETM